MAGTSSSSRGDSKSAGRFTLSDLIKTTYGDKPKLEESGRSLSVYSQGWFLIYFLNNFNVDEKGMVRLDRPGKYRERWKRYVAGELQGRTGLPEFRKALGIAENEMADLETEYWRYVNFVAKKYALKQVTDRGRLLAWNEYVNKRGKKTGEASDDLLPPADK